MSRVRQGLSPARRRRLAFALVAAVAGGAAACTEPRLAAVPRPPLPQAAAEVPLEVPPPDAAQVDAPEGYRVEAVLTDLTYPTSVERDDDGNLYVAEAGWVYGDVSAPARVLRLTPSGALSVVTEALVGPVTDLLWHQGRLYVSHRGAVSRIEPDGRVVDLVTGLPSEGDHSNNQLALGPDGKLYVGQGTVTNSGVVGMDNFLLGWLQRYPGLHDQTPRTLALRRRRVITLNPFLLGGAQGSVWVTTGPFAPFGEAGPRAPGVTRGNGAVLRMDLDGSDLEVYAWGLRNPFGLAWSPQGRLYAADNGMDERGSRPIKDAPDTLLRVVEGAWYGWPDFAAGRSITDDAFAPAAGPAPRPLLTHPPHVQRPHMIFAPHSGLTKLAFDAAGEVGPRDALYLAVWGPLTPFTGRPRAGTPFPSVLRLDVEERSQRVFLRSKDDYRSGLPTAGLRRPIDVLVADGALYVVDMGEFRVLSTPVPSLAPRAGTGVLWRVVPDGRRAPAPPAGITAGPEAEQRPEPRGTLPAGSPR